MLPRGLCRNTDRWAFKRAWYVQRTVPIFLELCVQAESKREAKMQKLLGSRDALKHRIHDHIQKQTLALQEADSKVRHCCFRCAT